MDNGTTQLMRFDADLLKGFDAAIKKAESAGAESFAFNGADWLVSYARFTSQYLHGRLDE